MFANKTKERTEKVSDEQKTSINNLETEEQANCEEFISFSRIKKGVGRQKQSVRVRFMKGSLVAWRTPARNTFRAMPTTAYDSVKPQSVQPTRKPLSR